MYRFIKNFALKYWVYYISGLLFLIITNYVSTIIPLKIKSVIDIMANESTFNVVQPFLIDIIWLAITLAVTRTLSRILIFFPGRFVEYNLRNTLYKHLLGLSQSFFKKEKPGDIISRMINDIQSLRATSALGFLHITNTIMIYFLVIYQMVHINLNLTLWVIIPIPIVLLSVGFLVKYLYKAIYECQQKLGYLTNYCIEMFKHIKTIKVTVAEDSITHLFKEKNESYFKKNIQLAKIRSAMFPFIGIIGYIGNVLLLLMGGSLIIKGSLTIGEFVAMASYIGLLAWPTASLAWIINIIQRGKAAWKRIDAILQTESEFQGKTPLNLEKAKSKTLLSVQNLSFQYPNTPKQTLNNINLTINSGEFIGIFGPSGSGKSTLINILAGIEKIPNNSYYLNKKCINSLNIKDVKNHIALVEQLPFLFSTTIKDNIAFTLSKPIDPYIKKACIETDITSFPDQLNTLIGEKGVVLSGGQQSRLALARAYYKSAPILLLDDILSAVDHETESALIKALLENKDPNQTIIFISHRISALTQCNTIHILENGSLTDSGSHNDLLKKNHLYYHTWNYQQMEYQS